MRTLVRRIRQGVPTGVLLVVLGILVVLPMLFIALAAFSDDVPRPGSIGLDSLSLDNFAILGSSEALGALGNSVFIAALASVLAMAIGCGLAFLAARADVPGRRFLYFVGIAPMFLPSLVGALAWSLLGSPATGFLNLVFQGIGLDVTLNIYSMPGLIMVLALYYAPYAFLLVHGALSLMNPDLEEAAFVHGGTRRRTLSWVTFPLALPAILGSGVLIFALTMENFPVAQVIGNPGQVETLPSFIYRLMNASPSRGTEAAAVAITLTAVLLIVTALQQRAVMRRKFTTVTGKGVKTKLVSLGRWRWPLFGLALVYFLLAVVLPIGALLISALQSSPYVSSLGQLTEPGALSFYMIGQLILSPDFLQSAGNSAVTAILAALLGTAVSFVVAYTVYRTNSAGRRVLEFVAMAPLAVPAIVLGLGLLWTWLVIPLPVYGTVFVLVIAFMAVFLPQGYRGVTSSILQVDRDLEDSAVLLGARRATAVSWVTLPLMRVGMVSTVLLLLMLCMRELSAALFLFTSDTRLLSILIFDNYDNGAMQGAASVSLLYCVVILIIALLAKSFGAKTVDGAR
ncbi:MULTISPECIES: ABC transporter permease [Actinoalloteichus]|uniref:ABC-type Fe3+ transport system, permease component n=1 Tax=Actinoalloteichus fjordicus TaxID=1612552 RepID=A0AAC9LGQ5_9PSEU|nr:MULTISPECIES: iron ABC transporter permease [Actinoalloteichus]APU17386.1 ABC-type Fe3+ transport system, permease component [Actinoalloteichus fjordicus]APU23470.1 ABC-type Fe3+ transport system, permease component [Actinoalloteichus sp. GBA129-24]